MDALRLGQPDNFWNAPTYSVKVRGLRYLWGSAGITADLHFDKAPILHLANDQAGEPVTIGTRLAAGGNTDMGVIQPGECMSVAVQDIAGVYAQSAGDTIVHCLIY